MKGKIKLQHWESKKNVVELTTENGSELIPVSKLIMIRLFESDTSIIKTPYTDFYTFNNDGKLYRLLAAGNYNVFDNLPYVKEKISSIGNEVFVVEDHKLINTFDFWASNTKRNLIRYVNKRFDKNFRAKNFKNVVEIINYISRHPK